MNQTCLPQDDIAAYMLGMIDDAKLDAVDAHLADCPRCQEIAKELDSASDKLTDMLREPKPADDFSSEPECQQVLPKVKKLGDTLFRSSDTSREAADDGELLLPTQLGEYHVLERIGGNMGRVYKALHTTMNRFVAIKVLPAEALADQQAIGRFQQEMKAVGPLEHPNIVRAYDAREIDGKPVLVMELVKGQNLSNVLEANGPLGVADACEVVRQAAVGLQFAHEKGIVHRDVKPLNLMLTPEGQVKVLDLGLARLRGHRSAANEMTGVGQSLGTPNYMAPEQAVDSRQVDTRADVYGLGCTLYKLLTGRAPYDDPRREHAIDILTAHLAEPVPSIKAARPDIPDPLAAIVNRMLAKSPTDRFENPGQVAAALEPFTAKSNLRALMTSWESRQRHLPPPDPHSRWFWKLLATAAAIALLVVGGKMAVEQLAPYWGSSNETSLARLHEQASEKPRQASPSTPAVNEQNVPKQGPSTVAAAQQQPQPIPESPKASSRPKPEQPDSDEPPITVTGPGPIKPPPVTATADRDSPAQIGSVPAKPPLPPTPAAPSETPDQVRNLLTGARNPQAAFVVSVEVDHPDRIYHGPPAGPNGKGEVMHVKVKSSKSGYLYLIYQTADGEIKCLYPNKVQSDNKITAGREITVPHPDAKFRLRVGPPYGKELLKAVVTLVPLEPEKFGVDSLTTADLTPLRPAALKNVFVELEEEPVNWAEHQVEITTMPGKPLSERPRPQADDAQRPSPLPPGEGQGEGKSSLRPQGRDQDEGRSSADQQREDSEKPSSRPADLDEAQLARLAPRSHRLPRERVHISEDKEEVEFVPGLGVLRASPEKKNSLARHAPYRLQNVPAKSGVAVTIEGPRPFTESFRGTQLFLGSPKVGDTVWGAIRLAGRHKITIRSPKGDKFTAEGTAFVGIERPNQKEGTLDFAFTVPKSLVPPWILSHLSDARRQYGDSIFLKLSSENPDPLLLENNLVIGDEMLVFLGEIHRSGDKWTLASP